MNRVIKFVISKFDGAVPDFSTSYTDDEFDFPGWIAEVNAVLKEYIDLMEGVHLRAGAKKLLEISSKGNNLLQYRMDNKALADHPERTKTVVGLALNLCNLLASASSPYMPSTAESITRQLNTTLAFIPDTFQTDVLKPGHKIGKAEYLFTRIDEKKVAEWKDKYGGTQASRAAEEAAKRKKQEDKERKKARKAEKKASEPSAAGSSSQTDASSEQPKIDGTVKNLPIREKVLDKEGPLTTGASTAPESNAPKTA